MTLKLYFDFMSQPSRALYIFFKVAKIPFEPCPVALRKGEHLREEFKQKSRFQKVPFIHDGDFKLAESVAIIRYVSRRFGVPDNWYPQDIKKQARVDEYLEWQHLNTRSFCSLYFIEKWVKPLRTGVESPEGKIARLQENMEKGLDLFDVLWLSQGSFITGDQISVADLLAACEIEQPRIAGYDPKVGRPKLEAWMERVRNTTNPYYDEAHIFLNKMAAASKEQEKAKQ